MSQQEMMEVVMFRIQYPGLESISDEMVQSFITEWKRCRKYIHILSAIGGK